MVNNHPAGNSTQREARSSTPSPTAAAVVTGSSNCLRVEVAGSSNWLRVEAVECRTYRLAHVPPENLVML